VDHVVVIGAGPGGLAAAAELQRGGFEVTVLERGAAVAAQWRRQYDRLSLNTVRWSAHLPRRRLPRSCGRWPSRDDLVSYLERYTTANGLRVSFGAEVERVERASGGWRLMTGSGPIDAPLVVVATGSCNEPSIPDWPGAGRFDGELLHSVDYGNATRFRGRDVLVVGAGNSGAEIATDLAEGGARTVWLSIRTPPNLLPRWSFVVPPELFSKLAAALPERLVDGSIAALRRLLVGDLSPYGLPRPRRGFYATLRHSRVTPIVDIGLVRALKAGEVKVVPAVESMAGSEVVLAGGGRLEPDAVVAATGYSRCLEPLVGHLGVLDERGMPRAQAAAGLDRAPGLYFIGFAHPSGSSLRELRIDARRLARAARRRRAQSPSA
jgi:putative flavoprotein involved in K+ transport